MGDIALGAGLDQGVAIRLGHRLGGFQLCNAAFQAGQHFLCLFADVGQLAIREIGHIGHIDLPVVFEGEKSGSRSLSVEVVAVVTRNDWTTRRYWTRRRSPAGGALGLIERHQTYEDVTARLSRRRRNKALDGC